MTNSHNRSASAGGNRRDDRDANGSTNRRASSKKGNNGTGVPRNNQRSPQNSTYFANNRNSPSNGSSGMIVNSTPLRKGAGSDKPNHTSTPQNRTTTNGYHANSTPKNGGQYTPNHHQHRSSPGGYASNKTLAASPPPNIHHFATSKIFESPSATALPRPPNHWTSLGVSSRVEDYAANLKMILKVQA